MVKKPDLVFFLILLVSLLLACFTLTTGHVWGDDFALYIAQAQSILNHTIHTCLQENTYINEHSSRPVGPNLYPWGFPLLLVPSLLAFGLNLLAMKITGIIFWLLSLWILFLLFKGRLSTNLLLLLIALFAFHPAY